MRTNLGETEKERRLIEKIWQVQDRLPVLIKDLKQHLRAGEFDWYVKHLASLAGVFIAMAEEIADDLLTDGERNALGMDNDDED